MFSKSQRDSAMRDLQAPLHERIARLTRERDELRRALFAADEYLGYHSPDSQFEPTGFGGKTIRCVVTKALSNADKETGG